MRFIGCAPAWRPGDSRDGASCLVVLDERGGIIGNEFVTTAGEIAASVAGNLGDGNSAEGVVVGVDAPLAVPNERGTRKVEKVLSRVSLPAYSASRRMFDGHPFSEEILAEFEKVGVEYTDYLFPNGRGNFVVEVDSAATLKVLSLERGSGDGDALQRLGEIPESRFRKGNKESRASALREAIAVLWDTKGLRLRTGNLSADLAATENIDVSKVDVSSGLSHAELDRVVSLVEGTLSAYTVHRHWRGRDGSLVVGVGDEGSVLLPADASLREAIAGECRQAKVAFV